MMITKAIVEDIINNKEFIVRIPIFDNIESAREHTIKEDLNTALAILSPGLSNNIVIGDVVYVGFEDNDISKPIILGLLDKENQQPRQTTVTSAQLNCDYLNVKNPTTLPIGTNIGSITYDQLLELVKLLNNQGG